MRQGVQARTTNGYGEQHAINRFLNKISTDSWNESGKSVVTTIGVSSPWGMSGC